MITDVKSPWWQPSLSNPGQLVEGLEDIQQCIGIILTTDVGSEPLRPLFGANIIRWIDSPVNVAAPNIVREIIEAIRLWEPRVTIDRVEYQIIESQIRFTVFWEFSGTQGQTVLNVGRSAEIEGLDYSPIPSSRVPDPVITRTPGTYEGFTTTKITNALETAQTFYTLNGTPASPQNGIAYVPGSDISIPSTGFLRVVSYADGYIRSNEVQAFFQIIPLSMNIEPESGLFLVGEAEPISMSSGLGAAIHYTTDGDIPTTDDPEFTETLPAPGVTTQITARAFLPPALPSPVVVRTYEIKALPPTLDTTAGVYITSRAVNATNPNPAGSLQYRIGGGTPTAGTGVTMTQSGFLEFRAIGPGYTPSDWVGIQVDIKCAAPTISPNGGAFEVSQAVTVGNNEPGGSTYYTVDGTTPDETDLTATPFNITNTTQIRTRTFRAGCLPSDIVNVTLTLFQRFELAGIPTGSAGTRRLYLWNNNVLSWSEIQPLGNVDADWTDGQVSDGSLYLLAATSTNNRLLHSLDAGASWALSTFAGALTSAPSPRADKTGEVVLCVASIGSGSNLHRSTNYGQNFTQIAPLGLTNWAGCFVDRDDPLIMYAWRVSSSSGDATVLVKSVDGGDTWTAIYSLLSRSIAGFAAFGSTIYMSVENTTNTVRTRLRSTDGGSTFVNFIANPPATSPLSDAIAANSTMIITRNPNGGQIFVSRDGTATWQTISIIGTAVRLNVNGNRALIGTSNRLYRSTDGGVTFPEVQPIGNVNRNWQLASL